MCRVDINSLITLKIIRLSATKRKL